MVKGIVGQGIANLARSRKTVLVECLCQDSHHAIEVVIVCVLMGTITAIGPEVHVISGDDSCRAVVPEADGLRHAVSEPVSSVTCRTHLTVPPHVMGAYADAVEGLVHNGTRLLVAAALTHAHPTSVAAVGGRSSRTVVHADPKAMNTCEVVPVVVHGEVDGIVETVVGSLIATIVIPVAHGALWHCDKLDYIAIAHGIVLVDGIGSHVIDGGGFQVTQPVDLAFLVEILAGAVVGHFRVGLFTPAEAFLKDVTARNRAASEGPCAATDEARIGCHGGWCATMSTIRYLEDKGSLSQSCDGCFGLCVCGSGSIVNSLRGIDGSLIGGCFSSLRVG